MAVLSSRRNRFVPTCSFERGLLAAALNVALDEFLGVLLQDLVDLVQEVVEVLLQLLALLGQLGATRTALFSLGGLRRPGLFPLLLSHGAHLPAPCGAALGT